MARVGSVLFVTEEFPYPAYKGGRLRDAGVIEVLRTLAPVEMVCFAPIGAKPFPIDVHGVERGKPPLWRRVLSPARSHLANGFSRAMARALEHLCRPDRVLWLSRSAMAKYAAPARRAGYRRIVVDFHNVESDLHWKSAIHAKRWLELPRAIESRRLEARYLRECDVAVATSEADARLLEGLGGGARMVRVIPNAVGVERYAEARETRGSTLFFSGTLDYHPNREGLLWFRREVYPLLRAMLGQRPVRIVVAGANPGDDLVRELGAMGAEVIANPKNMLPHLADARVVFVPLLSGSGTRLKIIEAMAAGRAVVSTAKGAEGLGLAGGTEVVIADTPADFASAIVQLWSDDAKREAIAKAGLQRARANYDWGALRPRFEAVMGDLT